MPTPTRTASRRTRRKVGDEIFDGTDYPKTWDGFVGQTSAVEQLRVAVASALHRDRRLDHILLASGAHGIGKTTLAQIIAYELGVGVVTVSGAISVDDARKILMEMRDGDVLFWDEFHLAVAGNRNRADWLLPMLTDHVLLTKNGTDLMPDVTVIAATTDVGKLPQTVISRFMIRPVLEYYTDEEASVIAAKLAERMHVRVGGESIMTKIARAANNNPRDMRMVLTAIRDMAVVSGGPVNFRKALTWAGLTHDGLTRIAQDILLVLMDSADNTASLETIQAALGEPGPLRHSEQSLIQKGYVTITGRGRKLTDTGLTRAIRLEMER
jgi:Holliday junction DNA helicase RuvB